MRHGLIMYSRGCRCEKCDLAQAVHEIKPAPPARKPTGRESLRAALAVQAEARVLGIATKIRKGTRGSGRGSEYEAVHWPDDCCQQKTHAPAGRDGACAAHHPF